MEERAIALIESTLFSTKKDIADHEYTVRLQNARSYAQNLLAQSDDPAMRKGVATIQPDGIFLYFDEDVPNPQKLGMLIIDISRQYPVVKKDRHSINIRKPDGLIRPIISVEGILVVISRVPPPGNATWLLSAFLLFLLVFGVFIAFAGKLSPWQDFATVRLYFKGG